MIMEVIIEFEAYIITGKIRLDFAIDRDHFSLHKIAGGFRQNIVI